MLIILLKSITIIFTSSNQNKTRENKKVFSGVRNHCKRVLEEAKSNYADETRHIASQHIG